jgi:hypothetical protein
MVRKISDMMLLHNPKCKGAVDIMAKRTILGLPVEGETMEAVYQNLYSAWRETSKESGATFAQIYTAFRDRELLAKIDGGALKLYLYFCFAARNATGESWFGTDRIHEYFGKQQKRTIEGWMKTLVDNGLIYRERVGRKKTHTTFLIPYSDTLMKMRVSRKANEDQVLFDKLITEIQQYKEAYGEIVQVVHLFQWGVRRKKATSSVNYQWLLIITRRKSGDGDVLIGHYHELEDYEDYGVNTLALPQTARFDSPFQMDGQPIVGLAIRNNQRLVNRSKEGYRKWLDLLRELAGTRQERFFEMNELQYGVINDILQKDDEEDHEDNDDDEQDDE